MTLWPQVTWSPLPASSRSTINQKQHEAVSKSRKCSKHFPSSVHNKVQRMWLKVWNIAEMWLRTEKITCHTKKKISHQYASTQHNCQRLWMPRGIAQRVALVFFWPNIANQWLKHTPHNFHTCVEIVYVYFLLFSCHYKHAFIHSIFLISVLRLHYPNDAHVKCEIPWTPAHMLKPCCR